MIKCIGTIETPNGVYTNPDINIYFLSYSREFGIMAFPQIMLDGAPVDQLTPVIFNGSQSDELNRIQIENNMCMYLENEYPECNFTIYAANN
jgi:hypothetical protein